MKKWKIRVLAAKKNIQTTWWETWQEYYYNEPIAVLSTKNDSNSRN